MRQQWMVRDLVLPITVVQGSIAHTAVTSIAKSFTCQCTTIACILAKGDIWKNTTWAFYIVFYYHAIILKRTKNTDRQVDTKINMFEQTRKDGGGINIGLTFHTRWATSYKCSKN